MKHKIKSVLTLIAVALATALISCQPVHAQPVDTNPPPVIGGVLGWIATHSDELQQTNWTVAISPSYAPGLKNSTGKAQEFGGTLALMYPLSQYVLTGARLDFLGGDLFNPSIGATFQVPIKWFGPFNVTPFAVSGVSMPISGAAKANGVVGAIYGAGLKATLWQSAAGTTRVGAFYEAEKWTQFPNVIIHHGGIGVHFSF